MPSTVASWDPEWIFTVPLLLLPFALPFESLAGLAVTTFPDANAVVAVVVTLAAPSVWPAAAVVTEEVTGSLDETLVPPFPWPFSPFFDEWASPAPALLCRPSLAPFCPNAADEVAVKPMPMKRAATLHTATRRRTPV
jgi:hypothetical protein